MNIFKNLKVQRGQIAELRFWTEAVRRGVIVSKPHEGSRHDFIVDCGTRLWRVQVKSTNQPWRRGYQVSTKGSSGGPYSAREMDFLAAYVTPLKHWYIIPHRAIKGALTICLGPNSRFARYRDAWHLLLNKRRGARIELQASSGQASAQREQKTAAVAPKPEGRKSASAGLTLYGVVDPAYEKKG